MTQPMPSSLSRATAIAALCFVAAACGSTVKRDGAAPAPASSLPAQYASVTVAVGDRARALLAENPTFSVDALRTTVQSYLANKGLIGGASNARITVTVTDVRARSTAAAVILGVFAGEDRIEARVDVTSGSNAKLAGFDVKATYALGGGLGHDGTRMGWLYERIAETVYEELRPRVATK